MYGTCRYKIEIEYDGSYFHGWQRQYHPVTGELKTVQGVIESALFKITGKKILVEGAGRTDTGVHAVGQTAHFDLDQNKLTTARLIDALNFYIRESGASILKITEVSSDFHARFSATFRTYQYHIINRRSPLSLDKSRAWQVIPYLDIGLMQDAAKELLGHQDFSAFRAAECQGKTPFKTLNIFNIEEKDVRIITTIQARSFLHHQVRIMIGTLKLIGEGKWTKDDLIRIRESKQRTLAGPTAPAHGLYLVKVSYDYS
jgi:tRNA pseudouridine38-40 synthase